MTTTKIAIASLRDQQMTLAMEAARLRGKAFANGDRSYLNFGSSVASGDKFAIKADNAKKN